MPPAAASAGGPSRPRGGARSAREAALLCLAAAAGFALDRLAIEILPGSFLSLGMAPAIAAAARVGPLAGALVALAAKCLAPARVGSAYALALYCLEAAVIGLVRRRYPRASILAIDALFWPLLGLPLLGIAYRMALGISIEAIVMSLLKVWLSGLFNAYLASVLADSSLADRLLGASAGARRDIGRFIVDRISVLILPVAFLGLFGAMSAFRLQAERSIAYRVKSGREAARYFLAYADRRREPARLVAALNSQDLDPDGRYELVLPGTYPEGWIAKPWIDGLVSLWPSRGPHPTDQWRASEYCGEAQWDGVAIRYVVSFESTFLQLFRLYSLALAACLGLIYGSYAIVALTARSLSRRTGELIGAARGLPQRIEGGESIDLPRPEVEELATLSGEFEVLEARLRSLFEELRASRDGLEAAVAERTAELEARTEEVRLLLAKVEGEREEERRRVARELHDELGQGLAGLGMALYLLERRIGAAGGKAAEKIAEMRELIDGLSESMRRLIADLRPSVLDRLGLPEALARLASEGSERSGALVECDCSVPEGLVLGDELKSTAYRVAQEALANALRHSGSPLVRLRLRAEAGELALEVEDEGAGFDPAAGRGAERRSFGILGMRERCRAMGGSLSIASAPGEGTLVRAAFPIQGRRSDARAHS